MKRILSLLMVCLLLAGCGAEKTPEVTEVTQIPAAEYGPLTEPDGTGAPFVSRFEDETLITLSDGGIEAEGNNSGGVFTSRDIIYYEDRDTYDSGYPYGEGESHERHTAEEAEAHTVVNITVPGTYRVSGTLSAGQIRVDLGEEAYDDPDAVVELILENADITCTVAPAILFLNVYECDGSWSTETAKPDVDTASAGANLILEGDNSVTGSHVAKIYKDKEGEKKLWKQDGAIYSYMSMNVYGPGKLELTADNEGLDTELHLTVNGGDIAIRSDNDGINTNEDGVSVTTINGGEVHIIAGLGAEGDGIDSNGYLVINGGIVVASANPAADAGLDSDLGSFIHGGTVIALGSTMDWAESDSDQVTMNLQFADFQGSSSAITVTREDGTVIFAYDPGEDEVLGENVRRYQGAILSCGNFTQGQTYHVYMNDTLSGSESGGIYDVTAPITREGGVQMAYTGTDVAMGGPGGRGGFPGGRGQWEKGEMPTMPEDWTMPEGQEPPDGFGGRGHRGEGEMPTMPEDWTMPEGQEPPEGFDPRAGGFGEGERNTGFYMQDKVNFFSGLTEAS